MPAGGIGMGMTGHIPDHRTSVGMAVTGFGHGGRAKAVELERRVQNLPQLRRLLQVDGRRGPRQRTDGAEASIASTLPSLVAI